MNDVELQRHVANNLIRLYVEISRLRDLEEGTTVRAQAEVCAASLRSWRTCAPTTREMLLVLGTVDRLLARIENQSVKGSSGRESSGRDAA
jgi:hypothetical protein